MSEQTDLFLPPRLQPKRKLGSPGPPVNETTARDEALDNLEAYRGALCEIGREVAIEVAQQRGRVTSVEVFSEMRARGYDEAMDSVDPRWMGVVFRESVWKRRGWEQTGSHRRPVAIWDLVDPRNVPPSPRTLVYQSIGARGTGGGTAEEIELASGLSAAQVRSQVKDLLKADLIMASGMRRRRISGRKANVYVLPIHHPDIV